MRLLLVEDDLRVARVVERGLEEAGHDVEVSHDGVEGLVRAETGTHDLVILDILLPELDGMEICRTLRAQGLRTPVLMLTARDAVSDRVGGLEAGADDYLIKPFALEELLARVHALNRRARNGIEEEVLKVGDLTLDLARHEARRGDRSIELTAKEFCLLTYLMRHAGRVLTKDQITDHVWGYDSDVISNVVEIYIHYLRNKIDRGFPRPFIRTVRGVGYMVKE